MTHHHAMVLLVFVHAALVNAQNPAPESVEGATNSIGMDLRLVKAGSFPMGSSADASDASDDVAPQHLVKLSGDYYLGVTEVTQGQWYAVMGTRPWVGRSSVVEGPRHPATYVSWYDAVSFCKRLSKKEGVTYRLPTEAEWEYACRGGSTTNYSFGDDRLALVDAAWFNGVDGDGSAKNERYAHKVGIKQANPWGFYDMHGNVYEWCADWHGEMTNAEDENPVGPENGSYRVNRGGGWNSDAEYCTSAYRFESYPNLGSCTLGFRVARELPAQPSK
jgi:formylglycine-generating enzyme required for sulfatase activity